MALPPERTAPANAPSAIEQALVPLRVGGSVRDGLETIKVDFMAISLNHRIVRVGGDL